MKLIRRAYERFAALIHELLKFGTVGAAAFAVNFGVSIALWSWWGSEGTLTAKVIATVLATTFAYFGNRFWTFRHREQSGLGREYLLFFLLNGIGLVIELIFLAFSRYVLDLDSVLANTIATLIGTVFATMFRFWSYKKWVFLAPDLAPLGEMEDVQAGPITTR